MFALSENLSFVDGQFLSYGNSVDKEDKWELGNGKILHCFCINTAVLVDFVF